MEGQTGNGKKKQLSPLMKELQAYERAGTKLYLEDKRCNPQEIVQACLLAETSEYMRDFVVNDRERVTEIHFIRLRDK